MQNTSIEKKIYSVSQLTENIKSILEENFPFIWISGEISNFKSPVSGHYYFTLKDSQAQINAIMFRGQNRNLKYIPEDGMKITGFGRISVYQPRGSYQIILEYLEPAGTGALQAAFEQLKATLAREGLFDETHKKSIPFLPENICLITSSTGSVVHDMIRVIHRRFSGIGIDIIPVKVQGDGAVEEIIEAIDMLNTLNESDIAILGRGGGSLEDLSAFNSEEVARAIFASQIPIISAIGHETDYTIADFVADFRAPTPSAAAELVVPVKSELLQRQNLLFRQLYSRFKIRIDSQYNFLDNLTKRLVHPRKKIDDLKLRLDDFVFRLHREFKKLLKQKHERLCWRSEQLHTSSLRDRIQVYRKTLLQLYNVLSSLVISNLNTKRLSLKELNGRLRALSPAGVLDRGYSITRLFPEKTIITKSDDVTAGQLLEILLAKGSIICRVEKDKPNGKKNDV